MSKRRLNARRIKRRYKSIQRNNSAKYCALMDVSRTLFEKWAYHKYRILMTIHEDSRVFWRQGKEDLRNSFNKEM